MIARSWWGATKAQDAEAYLEYLHRTGFAEYRKTPGNRGVLGLRRIIKDRAEFQLISLWDSKEAIRQFAGDDIDKAVFYPEDERFLVDRDEHVSHYEVVFDSAPKDSSYRVTVRLSAGRCKPLHSLSTSVISLCIFVLGTRDRIKAAA